MENNKKIVHQRNRSRNQLEKEKARRKEVGESIRTISLDSISPAFMNRIEMKIQAYSNEETFTQVIPRELNEKIVSLFLAPKFDKQRENMKLYFEENLTIYEIHQRTGQEPQHVYRSIKTGLEKIKKRLDSKEWKTVRWLYRIKSNDSLKSTLPRIYTKKQLEQYKKETRKPSEVKSYKIDVGLYNRTGQVRKI